MISEGAAALLQTVPDVRRARGYRLYTGGDRRLLDLYQEGGRALLGHRPGKLVHDTKNVLERGVLSAFPSPERARAERAVMRLVAPLLEAAGMTDARVELLPASLVQHTQLDLSLPDVLWDARAEDLSRGVLPLWRPWLPDSMLPRAASALRTAGAMVVRLPLPSLFAVEAVVAASDRQLDGPARVPVAEPALKAVSVVCGVLERSPVPLAHSLPGFAGCGPYLWMETVIGSQSSTDALQAYAERFSSFLAHDILISPDPLVPSVMPNEYSEGELKLLRRAAAEVSGAGNGN